MRPIRNQLEQLKKFAQDNGIKCIVLFGSRAMNGRVAIRMDSDFDIAVLTMPEKNIKNFDDYGSVLSGLAKILGIPDHQIDLTNLNEANILLRYEITSKGKLLYGDADEYENYKGFAFRDYIDAKPLFDLENSLIHKRQAMIHRAIEEAVQTI